MKNSISLIFLLVSSIAFGQLPDGSTAPDWTVMDLSGINHNLYDVLEDGKSVIIDFSATWCGICWNFHNTGTLDKVYGSFGPEGTDITRIYWMDADATTNDACVTDSPGCNNNTLGDWTANSNYPYINLTDVELMVKDDYNINSFPTIIAISPNKKQYEIGKENDLSIWDSWLNETFALDYSFTIGENFIDLEPIGGFGDIEYEWSNGETTQDITDLEDGSYSCTLTEGRGHSVETISFHISSTGISVTCPDIALPSVECSADEISPYASLFDFFEAGGDILGQYDPETFSVEDVIVEFGCPKIVNRIYSIQDLSGDVFSCNQTINIIDNTSPQNNIEIEDLINESEIENSIITDLTEYIDAGQVSDNCITDSLELNLYSQISDEEICEQIVRIYEVKDLCGNTSTFKQSLYIELDESATLSYAYEHENLVFQFSQFNNFQSNEFSWDFGDGSDIVNEASPSHTYAEAGTYEVCLTAFSPCGSKTICESITVTISSTKSDKLSESITIYPNPIGKGQSGKILYEGMNISDIHIIDLQGKTMDLDWSKNNFSLSEIETSGIYYLKITLTSDDIIWKKIIIQ